MERLRVLLAESHPLLRQAIAQVIARIDVAGPVFEVEDGQQVTSVARQVKPDVVLLDISLSGLSGLEITRLIKKELSGIPVVILLDEENEQYEKAVEQSGAWGCMVKSRVTEDLPVLLEKLQHGEKGGNL